MNIQELAEHLISHDTFERTYIPGEYQSIFQVGVKELSIHPDNVRKIVATIIKEYESRLEILKSEITAKNDSIARLGSQRMAYYKGDPE